MRINSLKINSVFLFVLCFLCACPAKSHADIEIVSAKLVMDVNHTGDPLDFPKGIYINGELAGYIPKGSGDKWTTIKEIPIQEKALRKLATENAIQITNKEGDLFKIRNISLEVITKKGQVVKSNTEHNVFSSQKNGWGAAEGKMAEYCGAPLPIFTLELPTDVLGFIKHPEFVYETEARKDKSPKEWQGLGNAALPGNSKSRTSCFLVYSDLRTLAKEEILEKLERFNAGDLSSIVAPDAFIKNNGVLDKIKWIRAKGYRFTCAFGMIPSDGWIKGTERYEKFFDNLKASARISDCIMVDEWYFSPALLQTEGCSRTVITSEFRNAFKRFSGFNDEDIKWAFSNPYSNDPRTVKLWDFCTMTGNDFMKNVVKTAKSENPRIKTSISYITHNWNKLASGLDSCINDFDEILNCQTYWYGRHSYDPLDAAKITNAIAVGKFFQHEYPDKFSWFGFGPRWTGKKPDKNEICKFWKCYSNYGNTPEEVVPYLATLYASGSGVFIFVIFNGCAPGNGSDDDYADVVRLVSQLVPHVKDYVKGEVAYYYDPETTFKIVRERPIAADYAKREGDIVSLGYVQQFFDADVVKNPKEYKNVIVSGCYFPDFLDYKNQNVYFMYDPEYALDGDKIVKAPFKKIGVEGTTFQKSGYYKIEGDVSIDNAMLYGPYEINKPFKSLRTASFPEEKAPPFCIGAENPEGNIRINSLRPFYTSQKIMNPILKEDFRKFGWMKRDCPQINGKKDIVAVAFRDPRTAVIDFGRDVEYDKVRVVVFNGKDGVVRNEIVDYKQGMTVNLPPLHVLVANGIK